MTFLSKYAIEFEKNLQNKDMKLYKKDQLQIIRSDKLHFLSNKKRQDVPQCFLRLSYNVSLIHMGKQISEKGII